MKLEHRSTEVLHTKNEETCSKELKLHNLRQQVKHSAESILSIIQKCKNMILSIYRLTQETHHNFYSQVAYIAGITLGQNFL